MQLNSGSLELNSTPYNWICEKGSYSLSNYMYLKIHNLTYEYGINIKFGHYILLT